jgi:hypothetical protein
MTSRDAAAVARPAERPTRSPIGFAVRDVAGRGCAFEIDEEGGEPLVFGTTSAIRVCGPGVLPAHFVVLPHKGLLVAASASPAHPAVVNGAPLHTTWTVLEIPSRIRIGAAAVDFFFIRQSGTVLIDTDVETTVADPEKASGVRPQPSGERDSGSWPTRVESARVTRPTPSRPLPRPSPPPMRTAVASVPRVPVDPVPVPAAPPVRSPLGRPRPSQAAWPAMSARDVAGAASLYVRTRWTNASTTTRVAIGMTVLILIFLLGRL